MATNANEAAHGAADAAHAAETGGMPQIDFATFPNQIFWLVVTIVVIYLILSRVALPRIGSVLAERQGTITNDIAAAEELKLKAQEAEAAYNQALADARVEAQKIIAEAKAEIQIGLDEATAKADAEIAAKAAESEKKIGEVRAGALEAVTEVAKDTAAEIIGMLDQKADAAVVSEAVNARLKG
ncbi:MULTISPECIES: F0F1 ATP synthase subunit B' [Actibacterium]|uniref:ATP synthase subunit b n=1 Tax=Actibacterium naphthalenivorans TaxID=1614693 RepID=A0A840CDS9_9RHOB|nr:MULTISPECIES: F0F1 ATP synthase subunit B' [Actibacterium]ALG91091.1 ATP F0F1 synthase subunit B' [Actibacterium sp. EMB200-NS6]MBB4023495.1 F-type H+-transporting ATPase subunit b [Actibacterium naphthalenivorans]